MDAFHTGQHCSFAQCQQLDFLPIECPLCKLIFCKLHVKQTEHTCSKSNDKILTREEVENLDSPESFRCSLVSCDRRELTPIRCDECGQQFCLGHRLPADHNCTVAENARKSEDPFKGLTSREKVERITGKPLCSEKTTGGGVGKRSKKTANKVMEMKLKMKATGENSIPVDERVYMNVKINTKASTVNELPFFFSREFSVGKMIDLTAKYCKLKNENHLSHAPKLRFHVAEHEYLPVDKRLKDLLEDEQSGVYNFGQIILSYVQT